MVLTGRPEQSNTEEAEDNTLHYNFMKMIVTLKEQMKNSLKEMEEKTNKKLEEINKSLNETQEKQSNKWIKQFKQVKTWKLK